MTVQSIDFSIDQQTDGVSTNTETDEFPEMQKEEYNEESGTINSNKSFEEMTVEELQEGIPERLRRNGSVTEQMKKDVAENVYHNSLVTWIKSFGI